MKPSRFARQHHPRYHMFYCKALRSCNVFRPTSFAPLTSDILHKAVFRGWLIFVQATNRAGLSCTSASTDETVGEQPLATSQIVLSTSCGIDAGQGFILTQTPKRLLNELFLAGRMIELIKKLFQKDREEGIPENSIHISSLNERVEKKHSTKSSKLRVELNALFSEIDEKKRELYDYLHEFEKTRLQNPNLFVKELQVMEGNRALYI